MTTNIELTLDRIAQVASQSHDSPCNCRMYPLECRRILDYVKDQTAQLATLSMDNAGKDIVISEYQRHSRQKDLEIERLKKELAAMLEAEHAISNAYVELRVILGAMNPPSPEFSVLTKYVSDIARKIVES